MKIGRKQKSDQLSFLQSVDITPKDDAYHGCFTYLDIEWWYFDAVLDNGYSIHVGVRTFHTKRTGIIKTRIEFYHNGKVEVEKIKTDIFKNFHTSTEKPYVKIGNQKIITFDEEKYEKLGIWEYNLILDIEGQKVDLTFTGTSKGWKIETKDTCWAVALPKAIVTGNIKVNGKTMNVKGMGYHDHNWRYSPTTALNNIGWFWGRITGDTLSATWAKTIESQTKQGVLTTINQDSKSKNQEKEYFSIQPKNIKFKTNRIKRDHRRWIPTEFKLQCSEIIKPNDIPIEIDITMKTIEIQFSRIFTTNYWRYHVNTTGKLAIGNTVEKLDNKSQIIEFLSFKNHGKDLV